MNKILEKIYLAATCISVLIMMGGTMWIFENVAGYVAKIILKDGFNILFALMYVAACVHCYLIHREDKKDKKWQHQGWVSSRLNYTRIKIEKNGKVVLDTTNQLSYIDKMKFYDKSDLVSYLLGD